MLQTGQFWGQRLYMSKYTNVSKKTFETEPPYHNQLSYAVFLLLINLITSDLKTFLHIIALKICFTLIIFKPHIWPDLNVMTDDS